MDSARSFVRLWLVLTLAVLLYAWLDLRYTPRLHVETRFSMRPDWEQLPDLMHWGGRLLNHRALSLLIGNAVVLGGMGALLGRGALRLLRRLRQRGDEPPVSVVPGPPPTSVPPAPH
ncbi:MAG: hypothetical protein QM756_20870 [Polyangiaceae bacterium]